MWATKQKNDGKSNEFLFLFLYTNGLIFEIKRAVKATEKKIEETASKAERKMKVLMMKRVKRIICLIYNKEAK